MKYEIYTQSSLNKIFEQWQTLECGKDMYFYQSFAWNTLLNNQFKSQWLKRFYRCIRYICIYDNKDKIRLIAPLRIKKLIKKREVIKEIELLGSDSFSDYVNLIYSDLDDSVLDYFFEVLKCQWNGYTIRWRLIPKDSLFSDYLYSRYPGNVNDYYKSVVISLKYSDFEDYYSKLSKSTRQNYRTSCNRMAKDEIDFKIRVFNNLRDNALIDKLLLDINYERTIEKNQDRFNSKIKRLRERYSLKHKSIVRDMMKQLENSWTLIAYINDDEAGFLTGVKCDDRIHVMMNKVNTRYEFYSPMIVAIIKYIEEMFKTGDVKTMDFGRGTEQYKYRLGGHDVDLVEFNMKL